MPAFASEHSFGLTKREYFAAMAMQLISRQNWNPDVVAEQSVKQADELIKALNK